MAQINLDWRARPAKHEILSKIHAKLLDIDQFGSLSVDIAETRNKRATAIVEVDGERMWGRFPCVSSRKVSSHEPYIAKFVAVGHEVGDCEIAKPD